MHVSIREQWAEDTEAVKHWTFVFFFFFLNLAWNSISGLYVASRRMVIEVFRTWQHVCLVMDFTHEMHQVECAADERRPAPGSAWNPPSSYFGSNQVLAQVMLADVHFPGLQHIRVQDGSVPDNGVRFWWHLARLWSINPHLNNGICPSISPALSSRQNKTNIFKHSANDVQKKKKHAGSQICMTKSRGLGSQFGCSEKQKIWSGSGFSDKLPLLHSMRVEIPFDW